MNFLIVVDMQVDFISGSLGSAQAEAIVPYVKEKIKCFDGEVIFTRDTHASDYLYTREGKKLPVRHCIEGTDGWHICDELLPFAKTVINKETFGSIDLPATLLGYGEPIEKIELCGLCTDICVISNAMILKAAFPEADITVDAKACAGVTNESHLTALAAMRAVQIDII